MSLLGILGTGAEVCQDAGQTLLNVHVIQCPLVAIHTCNHWQHTSGADLAGAIESENFAVY